MNLEDDLLLLSSLMPSSAVSAVSAGLDEAEDEDDDVRRDGAKYGSPSTAEEAAAVIGEEAAVADGGR